MQAIACNYLHHVITVRKSEINQLATGLGQLLTLNLDLHEVIFFQMVWMHYKTDIVLL